MVETSPAFKAAAKEVHNLKTKPNNDQLLTLYGLYKHGSGDTIDPHEKPSVFDFKAKYKKEAWQKVVDSGISHEEAQNKYVDLVEDLKREHQ